MEKLIELLNEYAKVLRIGDYVGWHNKETVENSDYIFTKKFGFIKWLVENDKIDFEKPIGEFANKYKLIVPDDFYLKNLSKEDELLMLLSIQDEPVSFLISCLK